MSKIRVTMKHGKPTIEAIDFEGDACVRATEKLEQLLSGDGEVDVREFTGEEIAQENLTSN